MKTRTTHTSLCPQTLLVGLLCLLLGATACEERNSVESVDFGVRLQGDPNALYVDEFVTFQFDGNPNYISFFSGEYGSKYANSTRNRMELDSIGVSYTVKQNYSEPADYGRIAILHVAVSEDFDNSYTAEGIAAATWTELSGTEPGQLFVPIPTEGDLTVSNVDYTEANLSQYKDKRFFFAFRYAAGPHTKVKYNDQPRIDITNLRMNKREPDKNLQSMTDLVNDWGFKPVFVKSTSKLKHTVAKASLQFQPTADHQKDSVEVWMVSQPIDPHAVQPDRGIAVKSINARLPEYQFAYSKPGTYTATFVATNANKWNASQTIQEVTFTVRERPAQSTN